MKKLMFAVVAMALSGALWADSYAFTYQAALRNEHGGVLDSRNHAVTIRLWNAPTDGTLLWSRSFNVMTDANGLFNLAVSDEGSKVPFEEKAGQATLASVFAKQSAGDVFIGLEVQNSAGEIVPRQRLFAVPFAAVANDVRKISQNVNVGGVITLGTNGSVRVTQDGISQATGSSTFHDLTINGTLTAGGLVTANNGLAINGGTLTVKTNLEIDSEKKLLVGGKEVVPVPVGGIIMWTSETLPDQEHWAVCDGSNGTPDLRARFVVGVSKDKDYELGKTGGKDQVKLTVAQMPKHYHQMNFWGYGVSRFSNNNEFFAVSDHSGSKTYKNGRTTDRTPWDDKQGGVGGDEPHENRPPYYALYYIMRVK